MILDPRRYDRRSLTDEQRDFLTKLVSFARLIQQTTYDKCKLLCIGTEQGLYASLAMAYVIDKSQWGTLEPSKKDNNLSLLKATDYWTGKIVEHSYTRIGPAGVTDETVVDRYRSYPTWLDWSLDLTDELTFFQRLQWEPVLNARNLDLQVERMSILQSDSTKWRGRIEALIERYGLWEFDW